MKSLLMIETNADTAARAGGIEVGTLNVWIQRRLLPGVAVGASGKRRKFTLDDVMHVVVMAKLVQLGLASPIASAAAAMAREEWNKPAAVLTIAPAADKRLGDRDTFFYDIHALSGEALKQEDWLCAHNPRPEGYIILELFRIAERVREFLAAEEAAKATAAEPPAVEPDAV
jgi:hypothetical protein